MKVTSLKDIPGLRCALRVLDPVPTLRGPKEIDDDDNVQVQLDFGTVVITADITAEQYQRIERSLQPRAPLPMRTGQLDILEEEGDDHG